MSLEKVREFVELEQLKSMSYEDINKMMGKFHERILELEKEKKIKSPEQKRDEFNTLKEASAPLMQYLIDNYDPHTHVRVESHSVGIFIGNMSTAVTDEERANYVQG